MTPHALIAPARLAGIRLLRTQTDERLVDLVRAGNVAAFEAIVARYRRPLLRYCSTLLPEERAEDAVQQIFLRAYDSLRGSEAEMHLRPWLYRIAHNTALNLRRDRSLADERLSQQIDGVERPEQAYERSQQLREVVRAVGNLPDRQRDALVQRELEGRSYDEIAASIGVSNGAVRQLLNRARMTLRAGATAVTPFGLLTRIPWPSVPGAGVAARVSELCGAAGGAVLAKVCATALVAGAVLGGVAGAPDGGGEVKAHPGRAGAAGTAVDRDERPGGASTGGASAHARRGDLSRFVSRSGRGDPSARRRRSGRPGEDDLAQRAGPGGDDRSGSHSGSGGDERSGSDADGFDASGPGPGGSGTGGGESGSGSSEPGSGTDKSGSDSGTSGSSSRTSGSGSSGSEDSDLSGTETSGSDRSGSRHGGSTSGEPTMTP